MNPYLTALVKRLEEDVGIDREMLWELLYNLYRELNPLDSEEIRAEYAALDRELDCLPLRKADEIWYEICGLCSEHEKEAFLYGVRVGLTLAGVGGLDGSW